MRLHQKTYAVNRHRKIHCRPKPNSFIRAKHVNLSFILKPSAQQVDGDGSIVNLENDLSKQLHASVRSSNLETSLRLLVQGADPNYFNEVNFLFIQFASVHMANIFLIIWNKGKRLHHITHGNQIRSNFASRAAYCSWR